MSPFDAEPREPGQLIARVALPPLVLLPIAPPLMIAVACFFGLLGWKTRGLDDGVELGGLLALEFLAFVIAGSLLYALTSPVRVFEHGLSAYNPWDRRNLDFIFWDHIKTVEERRLLLVPYIRITSRFNDSAVWVPRGLRDRASFVDAIARSAPEANALRSFLARVGSV